MKTNVQIYEKNREVIKPLINYNVACTRYTTTAVTSASQNTVTC